MEIIDLLIVEDQHDEQLVYERASKRRGLSTISFSSGLEALQYLRVCTDTLPTAYLVDMRTGESEEELASPLEIFKFLKSVNQIKYFRFHTGHFSEHDKTVHDITNAQIILKADPEFGQFLDLLQSIK